MRPYTGTLILLSSIAISSGVLALWSLLNSVVITDLKMFAVGVVSSVITFLYSFGAVAVYLDVKEEWRRRRRV